MLPECVSHLARRKSELILSLLAGIASTNILAIQQAELVDSGLAARTWLLEQCLARFIAESTPAGVP